jgi:hypothetical protein
MKKLVATVSVGIAALAATCVGYCPAAAADPPACPPTGMAYKEAQWDQVHQLFIDRGEYDWTVQGDEVAREWQKFVNSCFSTGKPPPQSQLPAFASAPVNPAPAAPQEDPSCVLTGTQTMSMTPQQLADWDNAHAKCLGVNLSPGQGLVAPVAPPPPPPVPNALSPLDVDCLKLEHDLKAAPPGALDFGTEAAELATDVPVSMFELGALGICGIDAVGYNIAADAKGTKQ